MKRSMPAQRIWTGTVEKHTSADIETMEATVIATNVGEAAAAMLRDSKVEKWLRDAHRVEIRCGLDLEGRVLSMKQPDWQKQTLLPKKP